ncbi:hypothetical protein HJG54_13895 [Leptolyngbya sp. NK1-12]|uniref:Uncharacterized protein n=1 Tax=Leptolyngbya sp. NK1-12 TaxID=2547451 RepID=A0AA96WFV1_9CYAN|nr:hypothetical protein [Leptolyngbya sp. NK1-12]WNZ23840.1 hypothetical protein HJG54_13895 [Leptolyngbya sp. NK1-12]
MTVDTLDLARQGDPVAIAALLNHSLGNKGVTTRATGYHKRLIIFVEYQASSKRDALVTFLKNSLIKLQPRNISQVTIRGSAVGHTIDAWRESFELDANEPVGSNCAADNGIAEFSLATALQHSNQQKALAQTATNPNEMLAFGIITFLLIVNLGFFFHSSWTGLVAAPSRIDRPCNLK